LHKKSRLQQNTTTVPVPVQVESPEPEAQFESDVDSLENARVTSSEEEEFVPKQKKTSGTASSNRIVTKSLFKGSPKKVGFDQDLLPTKRNMVVQRSVMSRLGSKVISDGDSEEEVLKVKRKVQKSSEEDEDVLDLNPQPLLTESKQEKKERKKKEKKKKKDKKKEKKKSKKQRSSSSDEDPGLNPLPKKSKPAVSNSDNSEDEELMSFFENLDSEDILLEKMKKKNDKLTARHKKVEEDRKLHS